jgi:L-ascorbate metabolism protein UlaG (beta-lactamase superfamily)/HEAT repeat protein
MIGQYILMALLFSPAQSAPPASTPDYFEELKSAEPSHLLPALGWFEQHPSDRAVPSIQALLNNAEPKVRRAAIRTLGFTRNLSVAGSLIPLLDDPAPAVRVSTLFALMRVNAANERPRVTALMESADPNVALAAKAAATYFGFADRREDLLKAMAGQDLDPLSLACTAFALLGSKEDVARVLAVMKDPRDEARSIAAQALLDAPPDPSTLNSVMGFLEKETYFYIHKTLIRVSVQQGMRAVPLFVEKLIPSRSFKELLAEAKAYPGFSEVPDLVLKHFNPKADDLRRMLDVLQAVGGDAVVRALKAEAFNPALAPERRGDILAALGRMNAAELIPSIRPLLKDPTGLIRAGAALALIEMEDRESVPAFLAMLKDAEPRARHAALKAVNHLKLAQAEAQVKALMEDPDPKVRGLAERVWKTMKETAMNNNAYWLGHDAFLIQARGKNIYFDPFQLPKGLPRADLVFITHDHPDHLSPADLRAVASDATLILIPQPFSARLKGMPGKPVAVAVGDKTQAGGFDVQAVPAYNPSKTYHPKGYGGVGYIVKLGDVTYYHAGDTDAIPEMKDFPAVDVCFLPVSGTYVMTAAEAADATKVLKCKKAVPMHYGGIIGSDKDAEEFKRLASCPVEIWPKTTSLP